MGRNPACLLFSKPIDSLAAAGAILSDVWTDSSMPTIDSLGDDFLDAVKTGEMLKIDEDGTVTVTVTADRDLDTSILVRGVEKCRLTLATGESGTLCFAFR
jgi:hypothetical protein